jgi:hypothetical protein
MRIGSFATFISLAAASTEKTGYPGLEDLNPEIFISKPVVMLHGLSSEPDIYPENMVALFREAGLETPESEILHKFFLLKSATRVELWFALAFIDDEKFELTPEDSIVIAPEDNQMNLSPESLWETMLSWRSFCVEPLQRFWQMPEDI